MDSPYIHALADVQSSFIGKETRIWQFVVILKDARVGNNCNICSHVFIENDVIIGDEVTIKNGVQLWDGMRVDDKVFIGPNVTFSNDKYPIAGNANFDCMETHIETGASIGAGAVILPGIRIGAYARIGAGAVVTKDVLSGVIVVGNPARVINPLSI